MRTWYGVFELYERHGQTTTAKVELSLPQEEPGVVIDLLAHAAKFGAQEATREYEKWVLEGKPDSAVFFDGSADEFGILADGAGYWKMAEEWNGGIGLTKELAAIAFVESMP